MTRRQGGGRAPAVLAAWSIAVLALSQGGAARAADAAAPGRAEAGRKVYEQRCAICHAAPEVGFVVLARRSAPGQGDLAARGRVPEALVRHVVRHGIGLMAPFSKVAVSDEELQAVAAYLARPVPEAAR